MPRLNRPRTSSSDDANRRDNHEQEALNTTSKSERQPPEQLGRLAELVASGELSLPVDLPPDQLELLVRKVRQRRRRRLVRFIADAIAMDIHRSREL